MPEDDGLRPDPHRAAEQLCEHPDAIGALLELYAAGGSADLGHLMRAYPETPIDGALRWLTAQRLVHRNGGAGSIDDVDHCATFTLTALGEALASSVAAFATFAEQTSWDPKSSNGRPRWSLRPCRHAR
ncbi:hypothetical protein [Krasilnikovia sp. MM14-A1004]|uniref:hypothetical protein n=1 Tax=Krasilnikovia sp. MM14-A1004 TaxID=3373541 RepID=UPI00399C6FDC